VEGEFIPSEEQFREEIREEVAEIVKQQLKLKASVEASSLSETTSSRSRGSPGIDRTVVSTIMSVVCLHIILTLVVVSCLQ